MSLDITGKKELASLKFDWKIYQLDAVSTKCCAGGTRDMTRTHGKKGKLVSLISKQYDKKDAESISSAYGYLR